MKLTIAQTQSLKCLVNAHSKGHEWVPYGNRTYPVAVVRLLKEKGLVMASSDKIRATQLGLELAQKFPAS